MRKDYFYQDDTQKIVTFELSEKNLMVNATEMAKIYGKLVGHFLENDATEKFIKACLNNRNSDYLAIEKREDLIISKQKSGTWMHKVLAVKFAAWLDPDFEVWVYATIERLIFADYQRLKASQKKSANRRNKIEKVKTKLRQNSTDFVELEKLEKEENTAARNRSKEITTQIKIFQEEEE